MTEVQTGCFRRLDKVVKQYTLRRRTLNFTAKFCSSTQLWLKSTISCFIAAGDWASGSPDLKSLDTVCGRTGEHGPTENLEK